MERFTARIRLLIWITAFGLTEIFLFSCSLVSANNNPLYCNQVLNEENIIIKKSVSFQDKLADLYDVYSNRKIATDSCELDRDHGIWIVFERVTRISDIFIEDSYLTTDPSAIELTLWSGTRSFHCTCARSKQTHSGRTFFDYECADGTGYNWAGFFVNAIEMKSVTPLTVNVTDLQRQRPLGWLVPIQFANENALQYPERCPPPGRYPGQTTLEPVKSFYPTRANVTIQCEDDRFTLEPSTVRTCGANGKWTPSKPPMCQPTKREWYRSQSSPFNQQRISAGMRNVSHVFPFNRDLFSILKVDLDFTQILNTSETKRLSNNVVYHFINSSGSVVYELRFGLIDFDNNNAGITSMFSKMPISYCANCSVQITFLEYAWNFWIIKDTFTVYASSPLKKQDAEQYLKLSTACAPIDPYFGMPERYKNYELTLNGSINDLLLQSPCRTGYKFAGDKKEINQCVNGQWKGGGFPDCKLIRTRTPPKVDGAVWRYIHHDVFHEIQYTGKLSHGVFREIPYARNITYNVEVDNWFDVPADYGTIGRRETQMLFTSPPLAPTFELSTITTIASTAALLPSAGDNLKTGKTDSMPFIVTGIVIGNVVILLSATAVAIAIKRKKKRQSKATSSAAADVTIKYTQNDDKSYDDLAGYLQPVQCPSQLDRNYSHRHDKEVCGDDDAHVYQEITGDDHIYDII